MELSGPASTLVFPTALAALTIWSLRLTSFCSLTALSMVTSVTFQFLKLTMRPKRRRAMRSIAWVPNIVASARSNAVGVPPRWM